MDSVRGKDADETIRKLELVMKQADVTPAIFPAVAASLKRAEETGGPAGAPRAVAVRNVLRGCLPTAGRPGRTAAPGPRSSQGGT